MEHIWWLLLSMAEEFLKNSQFKLDLHREIYKKREKDVYKRSTVET